MAASKLRAVNTYGSTRPRRRSWQGAAEDALVAYLEKARELADGCGDTRQVNDLLKTIGEIVGTGTMLGRRTQRQTTSTSTAREEDGDGDE